MKRTIAFPTPCKCGRHGALPEVPLKMAHKFSERCPFVSEEFLHEVLKGTCCTVDQDDLIAALRECREDDLVAAARRPMSAEEAMAFRKDLRSAADAALPGHELSSRNRQHRPLLLRDEVIRFASDWYWHVGSLGFGVSVEAEQ